MGKLIYKSDKIFIAGASGLAGSAILKAFRKKGYGNLEEGGSILTPSSKDLNFINKNEVEDWLSVNKPHIVVIAAGKVGGIHANNSQPTEFLLENLKIELNLIEAAWKYGVRRLLFLGSSCIYPKDIECPIKEESLLEGKLERTNEYYALAKIVGIKLCEALRKQYDFNAVSLMPTNLYGPNDNYDEKSSHVMAALIKRFVEAKKNNLSTVSCWGTGNPLREFLHVDDLGEACIHVLEKWDPRMSDSPLDSNGEKLNILNVGTGKEISIKDLANKIAKITGFEGTILWDKSKPDGVKSKVLDISKIKSLGWEPKINFDSGLQKVVHDYFIKSP